MPAQRPLRASAANRVTCTTLSTPAGAEGTAGPGANSTASDTRTTTANTPRDSAPCTANSSRIESRSLQAVQVRRAVRADDGQAGGPGEQVGGDIPHLLLGHRLQPVQHL